MLFIICVALLVIGIVIDLWVFQFAFISWIAALISSVVMLNGLGTAYGSNQDPWVEEFNGEQYVCSVGVEEYSTRWLVPWGGNIMHSNGDKTCVVVTG